jgi:hypothetical protein
MADQVFTITIPEAQVPRVVDALSAHFGWTAEDGPKGAFVKSGLVDLLKRLVLRQEQRDASRTAAENPLPDISK